MERSTTTDDDNKRKRRSAWECAELERHELPRLRPMDLQALLNVSSMTAWRIRQMPGFPEPDALGRFDRQAVLAFMASLTPERMRAHRRLLDARRRADTLGTEHAAGRGRPVPLTPPAIPPKTRGKTQAPAEPVAAKARRGAKTR